MPEPTSARWHQRQEPHQRNQERDRRQCPPRRCVEHHEAGRHLDPSTLTSRLNAIGIDPRPVRLAAISQLARDVPPAMLISVLGVSANTATRWTATSGGAWAPYAATTHPS